MVYYGSPKRRNGKVSKDKAVDAAPERVRLTKIYSLIELCSDSPKLVLELIVKGKESYVLLANT